MFTDRKKIYKNFLGLLEAVEDDHDRMGAVGKGHDFLHAFVVAQYAAIIAPDDEIAVLSFLAGMLHNSDYLFGEANVPERVVGYLRDHTKLGDKERELVVEAVVNHSKLNDPEDNPVTVALKDADRLGNTGPQFLIRVGQCHKGIPALDPVFTISNPNPLGTYRDPKSLANHIGFTLGWEGMLRLPGAREIGKKRFGMTRTCLEDIEDQLKEVGLYPYQAE